MPLADGGSPAPGDPEGGWGDGQQETRAGPAGRHLVAGAGDEGERLDRFLASRLEVSRGHAQQLLAAGVVTVAGRPAGKSDRLTPGSEVAVGELPPEPPSAPPPPLEVRHADDHLLVVVKPAGLVVHAGAGTTGPTMVDALLAMGVPLAPAADGDPARPGIVHRLDRGTSGLLVVAKTPVARSGLAALFSRHDVDRRYWALVEGVPDPPSATIDAPIARDPARRTRFRVDPGGRRAVSHYDVVEDFGRAARLTVRLETGRTHQVRVHLSAVGHPVCGDVVYGADRVLARDLGSGAAGAGEPGGLERPALHAARLAFTHPVTGAAVDVTEPPPGELRTAVERLRALRDGTAG